jgi:hypothetical protein
MSKKIHSVLFHLLVMVVYVVFFSVQFLYNSGGQSTTENIIKYSACTRCTGIASVDKSSPLSSSHPFSHSVRLNKHFHQADIFPGTVFFVEVPQPFLIPKILFYYREPSAPSSTPIGRFLRGPPFAA